jgi:hypothetical protein
MAGMRDRSEDIVLKLRQVEVLQGQGMVIGDAVRRSASPSRPTIGGASSMAG